MAKTIEKHIKIGITTVLGMPCMHTARIYYDGTSAQNGAERVVSVIVAQIQSPYKKMRHPTSYHARACRETTQCGSRVSYSIDGTRGIGRGSAGG